jgi:hypothetical protein
VSRQTPGAPRLRTIRTRRAGEFGCRPALEQPIDPSWTPPTG